MPENIIEFVMVFKKPSCGHEPITKGCDECDKYLYAIRLYKSIPQIPNSCFYLKEIGQDKLADDLFILYWEIIGKALRPFVDYIPDFGEEEIKELNEFMEKSLCQSKKE